MDRFLSRFGPLVSCVLSGFDRIVFRGILQPLMREFGMYYMLKDAGVQLLDFKRFALATTEQLKEASLAEAHRTHRPILYLNSGDIDKQDLARKTLAANPVEQGLICVFKALEPCMTFEYQRSADRDKRGLRLVPGKCLHLYHYWLDPRFGCMNARIQTWFPFTIQICINGREWLAHQLLRKGQNNFKRSDNCFSWLGNPKLAQRLMDDQLTTAWPLALNAIARLANPCHETIFRARQNDPDGKLEWLPLRKGVADLHRRAEVSQRSNQTYFNALAAVGDTTPCSQLFDTVSRPVTDRGRRVRALRLADPADIALLEAIARGEFAISGFRNRDIRRQLHPASATDSPIEQRRLAAKVTRQLRILRAHGLIQKIQKTTRYRLTSHGHTLIAAIFATRNADITQLLNKAA